MSDAILATEHPKARKAHRCIWCGGSIAAGETYTRQQLVWEGTPQSNKYHADCFDSIDWTDCDGGFTPYEGERPGPRQRTTQETER